MDAKTLAKQRQDEYNDVVADAALELLHVLDVNDERDMDEQLIEATDELENSHPWVLDDELAFIVLRCSNHPTAEIFHHGTPMKSEESKFGKAQFPFGTCAAAALAEDVKDYFRETFGLNGPLSHKWVRKAQKANKR